LLQTWLFLYIPLSQQVANLSKPVEKVGNLIDLSRHVVIDLSGCQPAETRKSCKL